MREFINNLDISETNSYTEPLVNILTDLDMELKVKVKSSDPL